MPSDLIPAARAALRALLRIRAGNPVRLDARIERLSAALVAVGGWPPKRKGKAS